MSKQKNLSKPPILHRFYRDPHPIVDSKGHIFAVLAGMPADPTYKASTTSAYLDFKAIGKGKTFSTRQRSHRRGKFAALPFGVSYGNGQTVPARLRTGGRDDLVEQLRSNTHLERIANFIDGTLSKFLLTFSHWLKKNLQLAVIFGLVQHWHLPNFRHAIP